MPVRLLSLPHADLQYALNCMNLGDLIALSLCSNRTKSLVKDSNRKIEPIDAEVYKNRICFNITSSDSQELQDDLDQDNPDYEDDVDNEFISLDLVDSFINIQRGNGIEVWRKPEFAQSDWVAHLLSILNETMIEFLRIENVSLSYLNTVKQLTPKCQKLVISHFCPDNVAKIAFRKLISTVDEVRIDNNIFDNDDNHISKYLSLNLKYASFGDGRNPLKLTLNDLLVLNITDLSIHKASITGKELNRFLKLWMKGSHRFHRRQKYIRLYGIDGREVKEEVCGGIQCDDFGGGDVCQFKRGDGKVLRVLFHAVITLFKFE